MHNTNRLSRTKQIVDTIRQKVGEMHVHISTEMMTETWNCCVIMVLLIAAFFFPKLCEPR